MLGLHHADTPLSWWEVWGGGPPTGMDMEGPLVLSSFIHTFNIAIPAFESSRVRFVLSWRGEDSSACITLFIFPWLVSGPLLQVSPLGSRLFTVWVHVNFSACSLLPCPPWVVGLSSSSPIGQESAVSGFHSPFPSEGSGGFGSHSLFFAACAG